MIRGVYHTDSPIDNFHPRKYIVINTLQLGTAIKTQRRIMVPNFGPRNLFNDPHEPATESNWGVYKHSAQPILKVKKWINTLVL